MSTVTEASEKKQLLNIGPEQMAEYKETLRNVRSQMLNFGNQIHGYLDHVNADVENYKFTVEKRGEGIEIEVQFKAYVHPSKTTTVIPK